MGSGFSKMKKQARMFEQQMEKMREESKQKKIQGTSGNGLVEVTINGEKELQEIHIKQDCVDPQDVEGLQDLIKAACGDAYKKLGNASPDMGITSPFSF